MNRNPQIFFILNSELFSVYLAFDRFLVKHIQILNIKYQQSDAADLFLVTETRQVLHQLPTVTEEILPRGTTLYKEEDASDKKDC